MTGLQQIDRQQSASSRRPTNGGRAWGSGIDAVCASPHHHLCVGLALQYCSSTDKAHCSCVCVLVVVSLAVVCLAAWLQPLYKKLLGFEVFGLGFMTSVVSSSASSSSSNDQRRQ